MNPIARNNFDGQCEEPQKTAVMRGTPCEDDKQPGAGEWRSVAMEFAQGMAGGAADADGEVRSAVSDLETYYTLPPLRHGRRAGSYGHDVRAGYLPGGRGFWEASPGPLGLHVVQFRSNRADRRTSLPRLGKRDALVLVTGLFVYPAGAKFLVMVS